MLETLYLDAAAIATSHLVHHAMNKAVALFSGSTASRRKLSRTDFNLAPVVSRVVKAYV
jgi:hypothetical protein